MRSLRPPKITSAHLIALVALFVSLGGTSFAMLSIGTKDVKDNSLKSADLKNGKGVKGKDVVPGSLSGAALKRGSIGSDQLADGGVGQADLAGGSVDQSKILPSAVTGGAIAPNAVTSPAVQNGSLRGEDIQAGTVGGGIFAPGSIFGPAIASNTITGANVDESSLGTVPSAATATKLGSVTAQREDFTVGDGEAESGTVYCPAGQQAIGGGARAKGPLLSTETDVVLLTSRPARSSEGGAEPNDGQTFDGWRASVANQAGATGTATASVWAICVG